MAKNMLIKVELLFKGDKKLLEAIKEHLCDSIENDFIEKESKEQVIVKSIQVLK